eukprot:CFRG5983T1
MENTKMQKTVVFLLDTSVSMNTRCRSGMTLLDVARHTIHNTVTRLTAQNLQVKFMLMTFDADPVKALRVGLLDPPTALFEELSTIRASHMSNVGESLTNTFNMLNSNRLQSGVDNFGYGRRPWLADNSVVVLLTDGAQLTSDVCVLDNITWPPWTLQYEPFRWDQRLCSLSLRLPATHNAHLPPDLTAEAAIGVLINRDDQRPAIETFCKATGGASLFARTYKDAMLFADVVVSVVKSRSVMISLDRIPADVKDGSNAPSGSFNALLHSKGSLAYGSKSIRMHVPTNQGSWPIPEPYWLDHSTSDERIPQRRGCTIWFSATAQKWQVEEFFFDKYALDSCVYTDAILEARNPEVCYQVFVYNSHETPGVGYPFGFLKASSKNEVVNLFVMPYNYPALFSILAKIKVVPTGTPTIRKELETYMHNVPYYYHNVLKGHLRRFKLERMIPANLQGKMPGIVGNYMVNLVNQEKDECARFVLALSKYRKSRIVPDHSSKKRVTKYQNSISGVDNGSGITVTNPFDCSRSELFSRLAETVGRLYAQAEGVETLKSEDDHHNVPIAEMGVESEKYKQALTRLGMQEFRTAKLREDELNGKNIASRVVPFGNPFADDKVVDESTKLLPTMPLSWMGAILPDANSTDNTTTPAATTHTTDQTQLSVNAPTPTPTTTTPTRTPTHTHTLTSTPTNKATLTTSTPTPKPTLTPTLEPTSKPVPTPTQHTATSTTTTTLTATPTPTSIPISTTTSTSTSTSALTPKLTPTPAPPSLLPPTVTSPSAFTSPHLSIQTPTPTPTSTPTSTSTSIPSISFKPTTTIAKHIPTSTFTAQTPRPGLVSSAGSGSACGSSTDLKLESRSSMKIDKTKTDSIGAVNWGTGWVGGGKNDTDYTASLSTSKLTKQKSMNITPEMNLELNKQASKPPSSNPNKRRPSPPLPLVRPNSKVKTTNSQPQTHAQQQPLKEAASPELETVSTQAGTQSQHQHQLAEEIGTQLGVDKSHTQAHSKVLDAREQSRIAMLKNRAKTQAQWQTQQRPQPVQAGVSQTHAEKLVSGKTAGNTKPHVPTQPTRSLKRPLVSSLSPQHGQPPQLSLAQQQQRVQARALGQSWEKDTASPAVKSGPSQVYTRGQGHGREKETATQTAKVGQGPVRGLGGDMTAGIQKTSALGQGSLQQQQQRQQAITMKQKQQLALKRMQQNQTSQTKSSAYSRAQQPSPSVSAPAGSVTSGNYQNRAGPTGTAGVVSNRGSDGSKTAYSGWANLSSNPNPVHPTQGRRAVPQPSATGGGSSSGAGLRKSSGDGFVRSANSGAQTSLGASAPIATATPKAATRALKPTSLPMSTSDEFRKKARKDSAYKDG